MNLLLAMWPSRVLPQETIIGKEDLACAEKGFVYLTVNEIDDNWALTLKKMKISAN